MKPTDAQLLLEVSRGDRAAFMTLYDAYAPRLYGLIVRILGASRDAEDVLQEVFREVWCRADRFDARLGAADAWLLLLARSRAIDHLRRRASEKSTLEGFQDRVPGPTEHIDPNPREADSATILAVLPEDQRDAICLAFFRGLTAQQIADVRDVPLGTVKTRIRLGMLKLREQLNRQPEVSAR